MNAPRRARGLAALPFFRRRGWPRIVQQVRGRAHAIDAGDAFGAQVVAGGGAVLRGETRADPFYIIAIPRSNLTRRIQRTAFVARCLAATVTGMFRCGNCGRSFIASQRVRHSLGAVQSKRRLAIDACRPVAG